MSFERSTWAVCTQLIVFSASAPIFAQSWNYIVSAQPQLFPYSTQAQPAKGQSYVDATTHTTVTRITASKADSGYWGTMTGYSTWDPLSSDKKYLILLGLSSLSAAADYLLYDANTFQLIGHLPFGWYNDQDPEPRWDTSGGYPTRVYYRKDKQLRYYDVATKADGLVHDFTADFPGYGSTYYIYNGEEGIPSRDSRFWAFMLRNGAPPYGVGRLFVYDKALDRVVASHNVTGHDPDNVGMSPSGNYIYAAYQWTGSGGEFDGPHAYKRDFSGYVKVCSGVPHLSYGITKQGHEVAVFMDSDYVSFTRLDTGQLYQLYYQGDLGWDASNLLHAASGRPGWGFISTYSENNSHWDYNQLFAIELDETKTYSSGTRPRIWRISFTQNIVGPNYYYQQPNAQIAYDGSRIWWGANWRNVNGNAEVYQAILPPNWWNDLNGTTPGTPSASAIGCTPTTLTPSGSSTCIVTLDTVAATGGATVKLTSNNAILSVPGSVTVGAGTKTGTFTALASPVTANTSVIVTAALGSGTPTTVLTLTAPAPALNVSSVVCNSTSITGAGTSTCTVTLSAAPTAAVSVTLSDNSSALTVPASVSVAAGSRTGTFTATAAAVTAATTATVTATYGGASKTANITLNPPPVAVTLSALTCSPTSITGAGSSACIVTLSAAPTATVSVTLSDNSSALTVPASVSIAAGSKTGTFTATAAAVTSTSTATVTATYGGVSKTASITLNQPPVTVALSALSCTPTSITGAGTSTCSVTLSAAPTTAVSIALSDNSSALTVPASVSIAAGVRTATFTATAGAVTATTTATMTATYGGVSKTASITLNPPPVTVALSALSCSPTSITGAGTSTCSVTLSAAPTTAVSVALSDNSSALTVPASVSIAAGSKTGSFTATASAVTANGSATVAASYGGVSKAATIQLVAPADTKPPTVTITAPQNGAKVSGTITVLASASDNVAVAGVQFLVDGQPSGAEVQATPYSIAVNTAKLANGTHTISAKARDAAGNTATSTAVSVTVSNSGSVTFTPIRVNAGGQAYTDPEGQVWAADTSYVAGIAYYTPLTVSNTNASPLYQSLRWNYGTLQYRFTVPNGSYTVKLKFADPAWYLPGQRVFNIVLNGQLVQANFDPIAAAGTSNAAVDRSYTVNVTTGQIAIDLNAVVNNPEINAIEITAAAAATATFARLDTKTQGTWTGVYGHDGYALQANAISYPAYATVSVSGAHTWTWNPTTTDVRAVKKVGASDRIASCWYFAGTFTFDVNLTDGNRHQFAMYVVDWDSRNRWQRIEVLDAVSGNVLDTRSVAAFTGGQYVVWNISGHVRMRVTQLGGDNAVVSGLFFN